MPPNSPQPPQAQQPKQLVQPGPKPEKDEKYAEALAKMAALDMQLSEKQQPETKHFIKKKWIVSAVISIILSIIFLIVGHFTFKGDSGPINDNTTKDLLDTTKEIRDVTNGN